jgi:predicted CopG family antitoxin
MKRKLTETEKREKQDLLLEHLNLLSDEEVRKVKKQPPD